MAYPLDFWTGRDHSLVAAYFAIEKYLHELAVQPQDAAIWILEPHILNHSEGFGDITPSIDADMCEEMPKPAFTDKGTENRKSPRRNGSRGEGHQDVRSTGMLL